MDSTLEPVASYYSAKIREHGATPGGVDWNSEAGQRLRFATLLQVTSAGQGVFSLDDYGCGYGALLDYVHDTGTPADYLGLDVSEDMIAQARRSHSQEPERFVVGCQSPRQADYALASGIFNVRLGATTEVWEKHIHETLDRLHAHSRRGFAFNCLTSYSDPERRRPDLYYGDPCYYFDLCKRSYSMNVALLHDYGLYEFTLLVRKSPAP